MPNLYGLDIRFRYTEKKIKEEKERRRATAGKGAGAALHGNNDPFAAPPNRHRLMSDRPQVTVTTYKKKGKHQRNLTDVQSLGQIVTNANAAIEFGSKLKTVAGVKF